jgi:Na+/H+ antiporter NhaD/arsenite permease-like protein
VSPGEIQTILAIAVFVGAYVLIATERVHRVAAALGGAALMLVIGATDADAAFFDEETAIDWNVIFLLLGMMIIVSVVRQTGLFEYLAIRAAKAAKGRPYRVMVLLVLLTAVASALLDNVTTVLLMAPVTLLVCSTIGVRPELFLIAEVLASNIGGAATLVGDPPNIIIASRAGLSFNDFLVNLVPIVVLLMVVFVVLLRWLFRSAFTFQPARAQALMDLDERKAIRDPVLLRRSLAVLGATVVGFLVHGALGTEPSVVALLGAGAMVLVTRVTQHEYLEEVEWPTLVFFAGLFVMVGALVNVGLIEAIGEWMVQTVGDNILAAMTTLLFGSAVLSAIVDNIPFVATVAPLVSDLVTSTGSAQAESLWWALALGADLGGNATAVGASANVVVLGIAARNGVPISFWRFTRYGIVVAAITVTLSWPYLYLRYFVLAG